MNGLSPRATNNVDKRVRKREILPQIAVAVCLILFVVKAVTSMVQESATWDETHYLGLGKYLLQNHRWDVPGSILHPPLPFYLQSLPFFFFDTDQGVWESDYTRATDPKYLGLADFNRGQKLLSSPANQGDRLLNWCRFMMVLTGVLLGWFVYSWSHAAYGKASAILAAIMYSFSPNILANTCLITPDIVLTTFMFMTVYYLWRLSRSNRISNAILGGICFGLSLLSKFTGILLIPMCFALIALWAVRRKPLSVSRGFIFGATGLAILLVGYGMNLGPYFAGITFQREHANAGESVFFFGQYSNHGWWYYLIVAFLIKTPIATIILLAIALVLFAGRWRQGLLLNEMFLLVPVATVVCFFSVNHASIGLRYILPVYPFLFVFASSTAPFLLSKRLLTGVYVALLAWYVGASSIIHPHYLAYFNEFVGGPKNGYKCLVDSNLDWGQDLKGLKRFMQKNGIPRIHFSYFGTDSPERYGIAYDWLPSVFLRNPDPENREQPPKGWVAISATNLQGVYLDDRNLFAWLKGRQPFATIGYSIFVYKVDD